MLLPLLQKVRKTITDVLTPDDLRILIESEDEFARHGNFVCVFPTSDSYKYLKFFETTRYYNILLTEWLHKYRNNRSKGNWRRNILDYPSIYALFFSSTTVLIYIQSRRDRDRTPRLDFFFGSNLC
jgi:hypothetical protein